ncbi:glycosyltransferase family 39 protein [Candidatus Woesearchaeota archaeon]|nr:glycosyltransferase family 39 protein [Candidatus Woesearchaeota archaeon]
MKKIILLAVDMIVILVLILSSIFMLTVNLTFPSNIEFNMTSEGYPDYQMYYSIGFGYHSIFQKKPSYIVPVYRSALVAFNLPFKEVSELRFDLHNTNYNIIIHDICIKNLFRRYCVGSENLLQSLKISKDISEISFSDNSMIVEQEGPNPTLEATASLIEKINHVATIPKSFTVFILLLIPAYIFFRRKNLITIKDIKLFINKVDFFINKNKKKIIIMIFIWFIFQVVFFASTAARGISPDENFHFIVIDGYKNSFHGGDFGYESNFLSQSYPYHYMIGFLAFIFNLSLPNTIAIIALRLINSLFGIATLFIAYNTIKRITDNGYIHIAVMIILTNIIMYVFLFSMLTYDNLANFLAVSALYYTIKAMQDKKRIDLIILLGILSLGCFTKGSFYPIGLFAIIALLVSRTYPSMKEIMRRLHWKEWIALVVSCISITLLLINIGIIDFNKRDISGSQQPELIFPEQCNQNAECGEVSQFYWCVPDYYEDKDNICCYMGLCNLDGKCVDERTRNGDKVCMTSKWESTTSYPLIIYAKKWSEDIGKRFFTINSHYSLYKGNEAYYGYILLAILSLFAFGFNSKEKVKSILKKELVTCLFFAAGYIFVMFFYVNYLTYRRIGIFDMALQARYLFPVLLPMAIVYSFIAFEKTPKFIKIIILILLVIIMISGGFVHYIMYTGPEWYLPIYQ